MRKVAIRVEMSRESQVLQNYNDKARHSASDQTQQPAGGACEHLQSTEWREAGAREHLYV